MFVFVCTRTTGNDYHTKHYAILLLNVNYFGKNTEYPFKNVHAIDVRVKFELFTLDINLKKIKNDNSVFTELVLVIRTLTYKV